MELLETQNKELEVTNYDLGNKIQTMNKRIIELEDRSRCDNLIFQGISASSGANFKLTLEEFLSSKLEIDCKLEGRIHFLPKGKRL